MKTSGVVIKHDGKTFEFRGEYRIPKQGEYFLVQGGTDMNGVITQEVCSISSIITPRAILHLIPRTFYFGGVKFVKTGEKRRPRIGEWYLSPDPIFCAVFYSGEEVEIVTPYVDHNKNIEKWE